MAVLTSALSSQSLGLYLQIAGGVAFAGGVVLSLEHYGIGICFVAGAAAFLLGRNCAGFRF